MMDITGSHVPLRAELYEIGLQSPDVTALAGFYSDALGYVFTKDADGSLGVARGRRLRLQTGPAKALSYAAYAVPEREDLEALVKRLNSAGVKFDHVLSPGMTDALRFADPDGNVFVFGLAATSAVSLLRGVPDREARLQHIVFASIDVVKMLLFFTEVVGFSLSDRVLDDAGGVRTVFVRCSHEHHSLAIFAANENRLDHHCYEATRWDLIRDWSDHFARHRIPLKWGPGRHGPGDNLFVFVHDPDGNWVEVSAELEHVEHDRPVGDWPHEEHTLNSWGIGLLRS
jgi:catechol 2,3-dioxygenase